MMSRLRVSVALLVGLLLAGCVTPPGQDYTAFRESRPASILVLPPLNETPEVGATAGMLAQMTAPLAESGYYVLPVALVSETFRQNGLDNAADIHQVAPAKLQEIFGADTALYTTVVQYGSSYRVFDSSVRVEARARLIDLRSGRLLWSGSALAVSQNNNANNGLIGMLVSAAINQVLNSMTDATFPVAGMASARLLSAGQPNGLLYGPRSPRYNLQP